MRVPRLLRTPLLILGLLALQFAAADALERLRLRLFVPLSQGAAWTAAWRGLELVPPRPAAAEEWMQRARDRRAAAFGEHAAARVAVFDLARERRDFLLGAGQRQGVRRGALVWNPDGALAVVVATEPHLALARPLSARGVRLAVRVETSAMLPGGLQGIVGALEGTGESVRLTRASLGERVEPGDRVVVLGRGELAGQLVGHIDSEGPLPRVRLAAAVGRAPRVLLEGVDRGPSMAELFELVAARVHLDASAARGEVILRGLEGTRAGVGAAVLGRGRLLGRTIGKAGAWLRAERLHALGGPYRLDLVARDGTAEVRTLEPRPEGLLVIEGQPPGGLERGLIALTPGGDELVPAGIFVGELVRLNAPTGSSERAVRLRLRGVRGAWPERVSLARFRHAEERRRLGRRAR